MSRYDDLASDSSFRATLDSRNADELKKLVALLPGVTKKAPRKGELIGALERFLLSGGVVQLWTQLNALEQSAIAEAVHSDDGTFDAGAFHAKYGALPVFEIEEKNRWRKNPTLLGLFIHPKVPGGRSVPDDLREKLRAFVPKPAATKLSTIEQIPERPPRQWTSRYFDERKGTRVYEQHGAPLIVRLTEQVAFQDLRTVLRSVTGCPRFEHIREASFPDGPAARSADRNHPGRTGGGQPTAVATRSTWRPSSISFKATPFPTSTLSV